MFAVVDVYTVFHTVSNVKLFSTSMSNFTFLSPKFFSLPKKSKVKYSCLYSTKGYINTHTHTHIYIYIHIKISNK